MLDPVTQFFSWYVSTSSYIQFFCVIQTTQKEKKTNNFHFPALLLFLNIYVIRELFQALVMNFGPPRSKKKEQVSLSWRVKSGCEVRLCCQQQPSKKSLSKATV